MWICYRHRHTLGKFWRSAKVTCQYPDHDGVRKCIQGRDVITLHMSQDIQSCMELLFQLNQVVLSNISCYLFLCRDISARKETTLFIRLRVLKYTSRTKNIDLCVSAFNYRWKYVQCCLVDNQ